MKYRTLALLAALTVDACLTDEMKKDFAAGTYAAQQQAYVDQYADRPHIDACRERVKKAWISDDAGADAAKDGAR